MSAQPSQQYDDASQMDDEEMEAFDEDQLEGMEVAEALPDGFEVRRVFAFGFEQYAEDGSIWLQCSLVTKADQNNGALSETEVDD